MKINVFLTPHPSHGTNQSYKALKSVYRGGGIAKQQNTCLALCDTPGSIASIIKKYTGREGQWRKGEKGEKEETGRRGGARR